MDKKVVEKMIKKLKSLGVEKIALSHCTGGHLIRCLKKPGQRIFMIPDV